MLIDRLAGLRFGAGGLRLPLPGGFDLPGVEARGFAVELTADDAGLQLRPSLSLTASLPALPIRLTMDGVSVVVPLTLDDARLGVATGDISAGALEGIGVDLALAPISGGGFLRQKGNQYGGIIDVDLGVVRVQAMGSWPCPATTGRCRSWCC